MAADKRKQKAKGKSRVTKETQAAAKDPGPPYRALWHPAARGARQLPEVLRRSTHLAQSPMESRIRVAIEDAGLPLPVLTWLLHRQ